MRVVNLHERSLPAGAGALIDSLAGPDDRLWPHDRWPPIRFDRPLQVGARGGHGPVRYDVVAYHPGRLVRCRFTAPVGFDGYHELSLLPDGCLRHLIVARMTGPALLSWPLVFQPLHDALVEDALDRAELHCTGAIARPAAWSSRVRFLRRFFPRP
ncbi:MAG: SRPBCC family protein [Candidatus Eremiobacterota bacterium]